MFGDDFYFSCIFFTGFKGIASCPEEYKPTGLPAPDAVDAATKNGRVIDVGRLTAYFDIKT